MRTSTSYICLGSLIFVVTGKKKEKKKKKKSEIVRMNVIEAYEGVQV
jgi:hypothetical protein